MARLAVATAVAAFGGIAASTALLGVGSIAPSTNPVHAQQFGGTPASSSSQTCGYDGPSDGGGCDTLAAAGQVGLYTVSFVDGSDFFTYARQSGQAAYPVSHPPFNMAGEDYGIGPWTQVSSMTDPTTYGWAAATGGQCSYNATKFFVMCNLTSRTLVGTISGGVLTYASGAAPSVGQYVYSGAYGSVLAPYQIMANASLPPGQYQLAGSPPNTPSQTMSVSTKLTVAGFNFSDVGMYFTGTGYVDFYNNRFSEGVNRCANGSGQQIINMTAATNTPVRFYSNLGTMDPSCSNSANLYPNAGGGAEQASFVGAITGGVTLTVVLGTNPTVGQYITGLGFVTSQVGSNPRSGVYTLSNAEPDGVFSMSTGPILGRNGTIIGMPKGSGPIDVEYNYDDKVGYLLTSNNGAAVTMKNNFIDIVGGPTGHTSPFLQEAQFTPAPHGVSFVASGGGYTLTVASGTAPQVGWLVSTKNNAADHSFTTAAVTAIHGSSVTLSVPEPAQSNVTFYSGPLYTIPYIIQSDNVIINNGYSSAGQITGFPGYLPGSGTLFNQGSGTSEGSFFTTSGYANVAPNANAAGASYYVQYAYNEYANNVVVANSSANNYTATRVVNTSAIARFLAQGSGWGTGNVGAYPGSVATTVISGNYIDPHGAFGCWAVDAGTYTGPASGTAITPSYSGNIDLIDGSAANGAGCYGANTP